MTDLRCIGCGRPNGKYRGGGLRGDIYCDDCYDGSLIHGGSGIWEAVRRRIFRR